MVAYLKSAGLLRPDKIHGLVFDAAVFIGSLLLVGFIPALGEETSELRAGIFLVTAVLTQILGAWLKRRGLSARLAAQANTPTGGIRRGFMDFLLLLHFILFTVITLFSITLITGALNHSSAAALDSPWWIALSFLVGGLATYAVWWAGKPSQEAELPATRPRSEYAADGLLWISVIIITQVFWGGLILLIDPSRGSGLNLTTVVLLIASSLLFVFFYLPSRYLFLVEDFQSPWTWLQAWVAMLPVAWSLLIG